MWKVNPELLCDKHLLGEHVEMHMFAGCLRKGTSLKGYLERGLVEIDKILVRHDILAIEMRKRGMKHKSPLAYVWQTRVAGYVNIHDSIEELKRRCPDCREKIKKTEGANNEEPG